MNRYYESIRAVCAGFAFLLTVTYVSQHLVSGILPSVLVNLCTRIYAVLFALSCVIAVLAVLQSRHSEGRR